METTGSRKAKEDIAVSAIGAGITITGEVTCVMDLQIEGQVNGDVRCPTLLLNEGGVVHGSITAERVRVAGKVEGSITAGDLSIESTGCIEGDATYLRLKVAPGGRVRGRLDPREDGIRSIEPAGLKLVDPALKLVDKVPQPIRVFGD